jgi:hypothetical protein
MHESQNAFSDPKVACPAAYIRSNFGLFSESIKRLETHGIPLQGSMDIMENSCEKLSVVKREVCESVSTKLQAVLNKMPNFQHLPVSVRYLMERRSR